MRIRVLSNILFLRQTGIKKQSFQITSIDPRTQLHLSKLKIDPSTGLVQAVVKMACLDTVCIAIRISVPMCLK